MICQRTLKRWHLKITVYSFILLKQLSTRICNHYDSPVFCISLTQQPPSLTSLSHSHPHPTQNRVASEGATVAATVAASVGSTVTATVAATVAPVVGELVGALVVGFDVVGLRVGDLVKVTAVAVGLRVGLELCLPALAVLFPALASLFPALL